MPRFLIALLIITATQLSPSEASSQTVATFQGERERDRLTIVLGDNGDFAVQSSPLGYFFFP